MTNEILLTDVVEQESVVRSEHFFEYMHNEKDPQKIIKLETLPIETHEDFLSKIELILEKIPEKYFLRKETLKSSAKFKKDSKYKEIETFLINEKKITLEITVKQSKELNLPFPFNLAFSMSVDEENEEKYHFSVGILKNKDGVFAALEQLITYNWPDEKVEPLYKKFFDRLYQRIDKHYSKFEKKVIAEKMQEMQLKNLTQNKKIIIINKILGDYLSMPDKSEKK